MNGSGDAIRKIHEKFIDDVSLWRAGKAFEDAGDFTNAAAKYNEALGLNPRNVKVHISLGMLHERQGQLEQAYDCYVAALGIDSSVLARIYLGNIFFAMQRFDEAIAQYSKALRQTPGDRYALNNVALAYYKKADYRSALAWYLQGEKTLPDDAIFRFGAGNACSRLGDMNAAIAHYSKGVELDPADADSRSVLALALASAGKNASALTQMREAMRLSPRNPLFDFQAGNLLKAAGKPSEAAAMYGKALELKPEYDEARDSLKTVQRE